MKKTFISILVSLFAHVPALRSASSDLAEHHQLVGEFSSIYLALGDDEEGESASRTFGLTQIMASFISDDNEITGSSSLRNIIDWNLVPAFAEWCDRLYGLSEFQKVFAGDFLRVILSRHGLGNFSPLLSPVMETHRSSILKAAFRIAEEFCLFLKHKPSKVCLLGNNKYWIGEILRPYVNNKDRHTAFILGAKFEGAKFTNFEWKQALYDGRELTGAVSDILGYMFFVHCADCNSGTSRRYSFFLLNHYVKFVTKKEGVDDSQLYYYGVY